MSVIQLLKQTDNFTNNEKRLADYILKKSRYDFKSNDH
jgi:hypothetical protein